MQFLCPNLSELALRARGIVQARRGAAPKSRSHSSRFPRNPSSHACCQLSRADKWCRVARDDSGKPYTVRYEAVNAMLLNEFLKERRKGEQQDRKIKELAQINQDQEAKIAGQQKEIAALIAA